ncbi:hypothetical protein CAPTEDRAFT_222768 [Capitella teleta]|uniref:Peptidase M20 dimerisation domain-containing protein n=1 Tax=Capitella teleta TaxID=283909 RepID=R7U0L0_CAPTE|nr:hypothetical protein CAPTEDRAFT_222768 [Capitella teleta]|eukprot:ELT99544.1 hypothetical protein CAPTEDRAFT_222768 [Capitella teleta]
MAARRFVSSVCGFLSSIFALLLIIVITRTFVLAPRKHSAEPCQPQDTDFIKVEGELLERFQAAIRFQGVSYTPHVYNGEELAKTRDFIIKSYPKVHSSPLVEYEVVANYSLLYTVRGSDALLTPFLLMGHFDVVPVENREKWEEDPFGGNVKNGFIYGRGTIDNKQTVFGILESVEYLLKNGFQPKRSFYLAFGHDEETGGLEGAAGLAERLREKGVEKLEFVLDEGMTVLDGIVPGLDKPVALIGSSEKGSLTLKMSINCTGGHSSMPEKESCIGAMARAVSLLENNPQPSMFGTGPEKATFEHIAHKMALPFRVVMSNLWLFTPAVSWMLSRKPTTNAIIRTTTAVTMFNAGVKVNVIAPYAEVVVNHRIHPSSTVQETLNYDKQLVNDPRIQWDIIAAYEPLPKSPYGDTDFGYQTIRMSAEQVWAYAGVVVAPATLIANTDTRHYLNFSENIYRFSPTYMYPDDPPRFHGVNERISVKNWEQAVNFYLHLIKNADEAKLQPLHSHGHEL